MKIDEKSRELTPDLEVGQRVALATVVHVQGSAYRREGAKMYITEDGKFSGLISGGCLEADVAEEAKKVLAEGSPLLKTYALDEDVVWGLGLGCPGTVEVFIEPYVAADTDAHNSIEKAKVVCKLLQNHSTTAPSVQSHLTVTQEEVLGSWPAGQLREQVLAVAQEKLAQHHPRSESRTFYLHSQEEVRVFFDVYLPPHEVLIFGAGHDAVPLADLSANLGFRTTVVDPRPAYNTEERFPQAKRILADTNQYLEEVEISSRTYVVIMNHHVERDRQALSIASASPASYVGVLGPRKRREKMLADLQEEGIHFSEEQLQKMYNPIGLDIGAETPEEIALSIMAEIIALRNGHEGGFLQDSHFIHRPSTVKQQGSRSDLS